METIALIIAHDEQYIRACTRLGVLWAVLES